MPEMIDPGGYIRFVGGSRHNQHLAIHEWLYRIQLPAPLQKPLSRRPSFDPIESPKWVCESYDLTRWITEFGTEFLEYTIVGIDPATFNLDPSFWPPTRHRQPLPPIPKVEFP
jgi:hypothetical protein